MRFALVGGLPSRHRQESRSFLDESTKTGLSAKALSDNGGHA
jgi:hypothetical protein